MSEANKANGTEVPASAPEFTPAATVLQSIVQNKRRELKANREHAFERPAAFGPVRDFRAALERSGTRFIFECKKKSPALGDLRSGAVTEFIAAYEGIADAISVLTDSDYFGGSLQDLRMARSVTHTPLLRKDFVLQADQVVEAYAHGADAVLLMLSVLNDAAYRSCMQAAQQCGLAVLTEVHDASEMQRARQLGATIIGINNRNLHTLQIDLDTTRTLAKQLPAGCIAISESGIRHHQDVRELAPLVHGFLVGSSLMQAPDLAVAARQLAFGAIKICGITSVADAGAAYRQGASYLGLIFAPQSTRCIDVTRARAIVTSTVLPCVGVFSTQTVHEILALAQELNLSAVQLHGPYDAAQQAFLQAQLPASCEIWCVNPVRVEATQIHLPPVHSVQGRRIRQLFDTAHQQSSEDSAVPSSGGSGLCFNWSLLHTIADQSSLVLAGGVSPENIAQAKSSGASILDVNSCVESAPGIKDEQRLQELFQQIRNATRMSAS